MIVYCDADDCKWNEDGKCKGPVQPAGIVYCDADDCKWNEDGKCNRQDTQRCTSGRIGAGGNSAMTSRRKRSESMADEFYGAMQVLDELPPADVAHVRHSRWIKTEDGAECENCGREAVYQIVDDHWEYEPWCPHCGAKMRGEQE